MTKFSKEHRLFLSNKMKEMCTKHGMCYSKIYKSWQDMKGRCKYKKRKDWKYYGGRGITYDKRRESFELFYEDMGKTYSEGLTIDRIDNNGNYCKSNCIWANKIEQCNNRRTTNKIEYKGIRYSLTQWAIKLGIPRSTLSNRIHRNGWSIEKSFNFYDPIEERRVID